MTILLSGKDPDLWITQFEVWNSMFKQDFLKRMEPYGWTGRLENGKYMVHCPAEDWKIHRCRHSLFYYPTSEPMWNPLYNIYYRNILVLTVKVFVLNWDSSYSWDFKENKISTIDAVEQNIPLPDIIRSLIIEYCG